MASGDADHIEVMETSFNSKKLETNSTAHDSGSEDDDRDKSSIAERNASYDVSGMGTMGGPGKVHKSDRKIGHRRVGVGGEITYKKIQSTQIMGSIQLGIQHAVGGLASKPERDLLMQDFMTVETTNFPHEGSNHTPAHHYSEFRFKTYAPIAFRYFRDLFGIQPDDFLMSMCSAPLRELSNPGASGSIFYLTEDDEFIIKTVQHKEGEFLQKLLPGYYMNLNQNPRTLLPKFFGLFCYQCNSKNVRLVAMNNLLPSVVKLHQKYDLKGSTYKRKASKSERQKRSPTYKDLDFMEHHPEGILLEADTYGALVKTIQRDCRVLESFKIMDYSLLVGIHNLDEAQREKAEQRRRAESGGEESGEESGDAASKPATHLNRTRSDLQGKDDFSSQVKRTQSINRQRLVAHSTAMESIQAESEPIDEEDDVPPGGIPARNARGERLLLFVGVIDILQSYRLRKKLEHTWKSMIHDGDTVSVHRPGFYAQRFQDFMAKTVFKKIPSPLKHSPSKRKSITRPLRQHEEVDTPGKKLFTRRDMPVRKISMYNSPASSMKSSLADLSITSSLLTVPEYKTLDYPAVLSDRRASPRYDSLENSPGTVASQRKRVEFKVSERKLSRNQNSLTYTGETATRSGKVSIIEQVMVAEKSMFGVMEPSGSHINGSLTDSGIQTDNASTSHGNERNFIDHSMLNSQSRLSETREELDIPFIDEENAADSDGNDYSAGIRRFSSQSSNQRNVKEIGSTPNIHRIPVKIEDGVELQTRSLNRVKSPTFLQRFKTFFSSLNPNKSDRSDKSDSLPKRSSPSHTRNQYYNSMNAINTDDVFEVSLKDNSKISQEPATLPRNMKFNQRERRSSRYSYRKENAHSYDLYQSSTVSETDLVDRMPLARRSEKFIVTSSSEEVIVHEVKDRENRNVEIMV